MKKTVIIVFGLFVYLVAMAQQVSIDVAKETTEREQYAAEYLRNKLTALGYEVSPKKGVRITLTNVNSGPAEGFTITKDKKGITVSGNDATGVIYGCVELADRIKLAGSLDGVQPTTEQPAMVMRGTCIGLQKTVSRRGSAWRFPTHLQNRGRSCRRTRPCRT